MDEETRKTKCWRVWAREIVNWLVRGICRGVYKALPYLILIATFGLLVFVFVSVFDQIAACKERIIRWVGLILQISGFVIVAWQLTNLRRLFDKPSFVSQLVSYLKTFPSRYVKTVNLRAQFVAGSPTVSARLAAKPGPDTPLKERVEMLEKTVEIVEGQLSKIERNCSPPCFRLDVGVTGGWFSGGVDTVAEPG